MVAIIEDNKVINNYPDLINKYWNEEKNDILKIDKNTITCYTNKKAWWKVQKTLKNGEVVEYTWLSKVITIVEGYKKNGDIICPLDVSTNMVLEGYNDLQTMYPWITKFWSSRNILKPSELRPTSTKKIILEYEYIDDNKNKSIIYYETPVMCMTNTTVRDENWFPPIPLINCSELVEQYDFEKNKDVDILKLRKYSTASVWWKGRHTFNGVEKEYSFKQPVVKRSVGTSDPVISSTTIIKGINSFGDMYPDLLEEWDYELNEFDPFEISSGSRKKIHFICPLCGNKYKARLYHRTKKHSTSCPACTVSKNETKIKTILDTYNLEKYGYKCIHQYHHPNRFGKRYYYDFCIYDEIHKKASYVIEYDGEDHYMFVRRSTENSKDYLRKKLEERKYRDILKDIICYEENIKLMRIPYYKKQYIDIYIDKIMKELNIEKKENFK